MRNFHMYVPPGWVHFDLLEPWQEPVGEAAVRLSAHLPEQVRRLIQPRINKMLTDTLRGLAEAGAVAAYLSTEIPDQAGMFPIMAIRPVDFASAGEDLTPIEYLLALIASGEVELIEPEGMVGVRRVIHKVGSTAEQFNDLPSEVHEQIVTVGNAARAQAQQDLRRLEYTVGVPGTRDCWMTVFASLNAPHTAAGADALDAVTEFMDAWVSTVIWQDAPSAAATPDVDLQLR